MLGWATHPLWDVGVHLVNRQPNVAPAWYEIACVSFDFIVAAYVFLAQIQPAWPDFQARDTEQLDEKAWGNRLQRIEEGAESGMIAPGSQQSF